MAGLALAIAAGCAGGVRAPSEAGTTADDFAAGVAGDEPVDTNSPDDPPPGREDVVADRRAGEADPEARPEDDDGRWGPLAVFEVRESDVARDGDDGSPGGVGGAAAHAGTGELRIGEECVTLDVAGGPITLFWRDRWVEWDAGAGQIVFDGSERMRLEDGDRVSVGGSSWPESSGEPDWLAEPADACPERTATVHMLQRDESADEGSTDSG